VGKTVPKIGFRIESRGHVEERKGRGNTRICVDRHKRSEATKDAVAVPLTSAKGMFVETKQCPLGKKRYLYSLYTGRELLCEDVVCLKKVVGTFHVMRRVVPRRCFVRKRNEESEK
jgi:hypothetical protein